MGKRIPFILKKRKKLIRQTYFLAITIYEMTTDLLGRFYLFVYQIGGSNLLSCWDLEFLNDILEVYMNNTTDRLFCEIYKSAVLCNWGIMVPGEAFQHLDTENEEFDTFFHTFSKKSAEPNFTEEVMAECERLTTKYPEFAFIQHVIGVYLFVDFNAFHYQLEEAALLYLLTKVAEGGQELNDAATGYISKSVVAFSVEAPMSKGAYALIKNFIKTDKQDFSVLGSDNDILLFPEIDVTPAVLPPELVEKINAVGSETGTDYSAQAFAEQIGWYESVIQKFA